MLENILSELGLNYIEIEIYKILLESKELRASEISNRIKIPRTTIYVYLKNLKSIGLVSEIDSGKINNVKLFTAQSPEKISLILKERYLKLQRHNSELGIILPELLSKSKSKYLKPSFETFRGETELRQALKDMLLSRDIDTIALWPIKNMLKILTPDFFNYLNKIRIKNKLHTRAIWPQSQVVNIERHPYLGVGERFLREIRVAPKGVDFDMGYWIYGNKVVFISSVKESFGFTIESREMVELLKAQFEFLWVSSKQINPTKNGEDFLKTI